MNKLIVISKMQDWREELTNYKHDWYHTWDYHQLAFANGEGTPLLFTFSNEKGRISIPLLLRDVKGNEYKDLTSVYGYPGFLFSSDTAYELYDTFLTALNSWCNDNLIVSIFSRLNSLVFNSDEFSNIYENGETVIIDLQQSEDEQIKSYRKNYRNLLRRLEREGFYADWSTTEDCLEDFKYIYTETMNELQAGDYYYFDNDYYQKLLSSSDFSVKIYNVFKEDVKVCSGLFVYCGDIVQYHLSGTLPAYKDSAPTRMLIDAARKDASELGYKYLHLGGGLGGGRDSLFNFKYGFSKQSINFNVFKMVTNPTAYKALSHLNEADEIPTSGFFPLYRKVN